MPQEDRPILLSFFLKDWMDLALENDLVQGLRIDKAIENYVRTVLIHIGCGYFMRETVTRAKLAELAIISEVALLGESGRQKTGFTVYVSHYLKNKEPCLIVSMLFRFGFSIPQTRKSQENQEICIVTIFYPRCPLFH